MSTEIVHGPTTDMDHAAGNILDVISRAAADPTVNVDKLERLLAIQQTIIADQRRTSYMGSLAKLQAKLPQIAKSGVILDKSGGTRNKFAKLEDIDEAIRPLCAAEGFSFSFDSKPLTGGLTEFSCTMSHRDGHSEVKTLAMAQDTGGGRSPAQSCGSTISYARRYLLSMHLHLVTRDEDDDGNASGAKPITKDQAEVLHGKLTELQASEASVARFLNFMAAPSVDEIAAANFQRACSFLDDKIRLKAAGAK